MRAILTAIILLTLPICSSAGSSVTITFSGYPAENATLTNFPALVVFTNGTPTGFSYSQFASPYGYDLRFYSGTTELNYEIDTWNTAGKSFVWVQVPLLTNGTQIAASWGVATNGAFPAAYSTNGATWDSTCWAVFHCNDHTNTSTTIDSTANKWLGAKKGANEPIVNTSVAEVGKALLFDGVDDWVKFSASAGPTAKSFVSGTISSYARFRLGNVNSWLWGETKGPTTYGNRFTLFEISGSGNISAGIRDSDQDAGGTFQACYSSVQIKSNTWQHLAFTMNSTLDLMQDFLGGQVVCTSNTAINAMGANNPNSIMMGAYQSASTPTYASFHNGYIDELRIYNVDKSTNWLWAEYVNMASNSTFQTLGTVVPTVPSTRSATITFSGYVAGKETLTNFPALVKVGPTTISGYDFSQQASAAGWDFRFYSGTTELNYEVDSLPTLADPTYDVWVQVPLLTNGTAITVQWGDSTKTQQVYTTNGATWGGNYAGVYHLNEQFAPTRNAMDSTTNHNDLSSVLCDPLKTAFPAVVGAGYRNDDAVAGDYLGRTTAPVTAYPITMSGWFNCDVTTTPTRVTLSNSGSVSNSLFLGTSYNPTTSYMDSWGMHYGGFQDQLFGAHRLEPATWRHMAYVAASATDRWLYSDGLQKGTNHIVSMNFPTSVNRFSINGLIRTGTGYYDGSYDEIRIMRVAPSTNWIWAEWFNMASNTVFQTYGAAVGGVGGIPYYRNSLGYDNQLGQ